jgi:predicted RNase H-like HicB family nuclease
MKFLIAVAPGDSNHDYGVVVPDLPGCFSAGDTLDNAIDNAKEAIDQHCELLGKAGDNLQPPMELTAHKTNPDFAGCIWAVVEVPIEKYF